MLKRAVVLLATMTFVGCAPPKTIKPERVAEIRKICVVTAIPKDEPLVLDHTRTMDSSYTHGQFGVLGALIEGAILVGVKEYRTSKSVDGDIDQLRPFVSKSYLKPKLDSDIAERLSRKYLTVEPKSFENKGFAPSDIAGHLEESKTSGIDTMVFLEIAYGLAAYKDKLASVAIDGEMTVYDVKSGDIILKKTIESDQIYRENRSVKDLVSEEAKLLKEDLNLAIKGFSTYVGEQLEVR